MFCVKMIKLQNTRKIFVKLLTFLNSKYHRIFREKDVIKGYRE